MKFLLCLAVIVTLIGIFNCGFALNDILREMELKDDKEHDRRP